MKRSKAKILLYVITIGILFVFFIGELINYKFNKLEVSATFFNQAQQKFWAHHGFSKKGESYSVQNIEKAFEMGLKGVELDLFYCKDLNSFLVVHDVSEKDTLILDDVLNSVKIKGAFWFDLKNLNKDNSTQVIELLTTLNNKYELKNNYIVESKNAKQLNSLSEAGIYTCLWVIPTQNKFFTNLYRWFKNKINLLLYNYSAVSMPYYYYAREGRELYGNFPIHTWISSKEFSNNKEVLLKDDKLKVVLFDRR